MKSLNNNKRRISRWKMIAILDTGKMSYFHLDEYGRLAHKFPKSKPRNLNLLMNPQISLSSSNNDSIKQEITSDPDKSSINDLSFEEFDPSDEEQQPKENLNYSSNSDSSSSNNSTSKDLDNLDLTNVLVSSSLIRDTQWCIDYVTSHLLA